MSAAMNFAAMPPELNSALMYAGAGSGPLLAAATAWDAMAAELSAAADGYQAVVAGLTAQSWQGPSAAAMAAAAAPYVAWLKTTAAQAGQSGTQAKAAAAAYETAFAMTVPPVVIAANRARLATLVATNLVGQNTAAIAATEALYTQMWAQDATAMYGYAAGAAAATRLPAFTAPQPDTNPGGLGDQTASTLQNAGVAAGSHAHTAASQLAPMLAATTPADGPYEGAGAPGLVIDLLAAGIELESFVPFEGGATGLEFGGLAIEAATLGPFAGGIQGLGGDLGALGGLGMIRDVAPAAGLGGVAPAAGSLVYSPGAAWASMGKAVPVGALSVPQAWAAAAPSAIRPAVLASAESAVAAAAAGATETPYAQMALAGMAGRALAGSAGLGLRQGGQRGGTSTPARPTASPKPAAATPDDEAATGIGIVAKLRALAELRDSGILPQDEFLERKQRLLGDS